MQAGRWGIRELCPAKNRSGEALFKAVLEKMKEPLGKTRLVFETGACFIAGTLVHTKEGLVPIEKLKVGDWVLSAPESGEGERAYKRVVKTMVRRDQPIMQVLYLVPHPNKPGQTLCRRLTSTYDHPFWAEDEGWTAASRLKGSYSGPSRVRLADGALSDLEGKAYIYCTDRPGVGWVAEDGRQGEGWQWDYDNGRRAVEGRMGYDSDKWAPTDDDMYTPFRTTVFNIEVEDFHTYFVGERGVWVHNANCDCGLHGQPSENSGAGLKFNPHLSEPSHIWPLGPTRLRRSVKFRGIWWGRGLNLRPDPDPCDPTGGAGARLLKLPGTTITTLSGASVVPWRNLPGGI